jgi:hypothetical protein
MNSPFSRKQTQTQAKMNITQERDSQMSQSLFRLCLQNTRIFMNINRSINQILTGPCDQKTTTAAGRDGFGCCSLQRYARTARRENIKTVKHQNENEMRITYNLTRQTWTDRTDAMIEKLFYGRENSWLSVNVNSKVRYEAEY